MQYKFNDIQKAKKSFARAGHETSSLLVPRVACYRPAQPRQPVSQAATGAHRKVAQYPSLCPQQSDKAGGRQSGSPLSPSTAISGTYGIAHLERSRRAGGDLFTGPKTQGRPICKPPSVSSVVVAADETRAADRARARHQRDPDSVAPSEPLFSGGFEGEQPCV
ncbi:hypothetical protein MTO96_020384 [Rhipicephalus appendiculatus]